MSDIAVLMPTMGRAKEIERTVRHLNFTSEHLMTIYAILDKNDSASIETVKELMTVIPNLRMIETEEKGVGRCYEFGYHATTEDFVFIVGDDMRFKTGWLKTAMAEIGDKGVLAVADENSGSWCIFLARRSYVEEKSCVADRPNTLLNTDYDRIADAELVFTLQARGDIAYASFYVDHINPLFYGSKKRSADGKSFEISCNQFLIRDLSIPYSDVKAEIVQDKHTGVWNILKIRIVPRHPMTVDEFRYDNYTEESHKVDEEKMKKRAHLWGGKCTYDRPAMIKEDGQK